MRRIVSVLLLALACALALAACGNKGPLVRPSAHPAHAATAAAPTPDGA